MVSHRTAWTVQDAKAHLSEILRKAGAGTPQYIGRQDSYVVLTEKDFSKMQAAAQNNGPSSMGRKLLLLSPGIDGFDVPASEQDRPNPFEDAEEPGS